MGPRVEVTGVKARCLLFQVVLALDQAAAKRTTELCRDLQGPNPTQPWLNPTQPCSFQGLAQAAVAGGTSSWHRASIQPFFRFELLLCLSITRYVTETAAVAARLPMSTARGRARASGWLAGRRAVCRLRSVQVYRCSDTRSMVEARFFGDL